MMKNPLGVGSVAPSSKALAETMVADVNPTPNSIALELGVGTGAITSAISAKLTKRNSYLGIEIDKKLANFVQSRFPHLLIINSDACLVAKKHKESGLGKIGFILSGIPFVSLPKNVCESILEELDGFMKDGCMFRTFQYLHGYHTPPARRLRTYMNGKYGLMEKSPVVIKNIPPAVILTWKTQSAS